MKLTAQQETEFDNAMEKAADTGIALVGGVKALEAAMRMQHSQIHQFFGAMSAIIEDAQARSVTPMIPVTDELLGVYNNVIASCALVCELMKRGVLDEHMADTENAAVHQSQPAPTRH